MDESFIPDDRCVRFVPDDIAHMKQIPGAPEAHESRSEGADEHVDAGALWYRRVGEAVHEVLAAHAPHQRAVYRVDRHLATLTCENREQGSLVRKKYTKGNFMWADLTQILTNYLRGEGAQNCREIGNSRR